MPVIPLTDEAGPGIAVLKAAENCAATKLQSVMSNRSAAIWSGVVSSCMLLLIVKAPPMNTPSAPAVWDFAATSAALPNPRQRPDDARGQWAALDRTDAELVQPQRVREALERIIDQ
ncbi:uncharacterized protein N7482_003975 [Penicillium canariense]|uniref:Uncharacterized protein n=1 Tax=Penicillium canariense TaxID=189055 RepID=A0A9W9I5Q8_9EURO|nr:uncharacterized protein N7482_003975 [Penicillium canariense]KAJ5168381.1 hypothetical protein N7482_003975 [Penicillium canariense]